MISQLKAFLLRGDIVTLAVAIIIGTAFTKIVDSLVVDVITPIIGLVAGNPDFSNIVIGGHPNPVDPSKIDGGIRIGNFINAIINFLLVGTALFFVAKAAGAKPEEIK